MSSSEKFCLKWNDFQTNISSSFGFLRKEQDFSDVTLACDGDTKIEAHKVILAASSSFFSNLLKQNRHPHPLLYLRGISLTQLVAVVDFIYHGEVNIHQEDLDSFLILAGELKLRGLDGSGIDKQEHDEKQLNFRTSTSRNQQKVKQETNPLDDPNHCRSTVFPNISQEEVSLVPADTFGLKSKSNYEELDETINSMMDRLENGKLICKVCGKSDNFRDKGHLKQHIEARHIEGISHPCHQCGKNLRSRHSLVQHVSTSHKL